MTTELKIPNPVDVHAGARLRLRRTLLGLSQEKLGEKVGLTFQQIQKYERGSNRMGASRLYAFSRILDVPVAYFFEDMPDAVAAGVPGATAAPTGDADIMSKRETLELVRAYHTIRSQDTRKRFADLIKTMAKEEAKALNRTRQ